jgi:hypothetical protein
MQKPADRMDVPAPAASASLPPAPPAIVTPAPAPTLPPLTYVVTPAPPAAGGPAITQIAMSDQVAHSGAPYLLLVTTTPDVTGVTIEAYGVRFALYPAGPGRFGVTGQIPTIPWIIANRTIAVRFVATTADGRSYTASLDARIGR